MKPGIRSKLAAIVLGLIAALPWTWAVAQTPAKQLFGGKDLPVVAKPQVFGSYARGCLAGGMALPVNGPTWQAMRLERNRRWGHPDMIALVERLSREAVADGWPGLLVGDISQPRGGPMLSGHASHQLGIDADIWLTPMPARTLTQAERRDMSAISMLKGDTLYVDPNRWTAAHGRLIARAASYPQVQRIFVHPGIKKKLCETYGANSANDGWLNKVRPIYGHHYHFHIRMRCPAGSPGCKPQESTGRGNQCGDELAWWFTDEPWRPKKKDPNAKPPRQVTLADLPKACAVVLDGPAPASIDEVTYGLGGAPGAAAPSIAAAAPVAASAGQSAFLPETGPLPGERPW